LELARVNGQVKSTAEQGRGTEVDGSEALAEPISMDTSVPSQLLENVQEPVSYTHLTLPTTPYV
jgi:hypothetical protein